MTVEINRQMAMDPKIEIKKEVEALRQAVLKSNRNHQCIDLTDSDTEDIQNGLNDTITIEQELSSMTDDSSDGPADILSGNIQFLLDNTVQLIFFSISFMNKIQLNNQYKMRFLCPFYYKL